LSHPPPPPLRPPASRPATPISRSCWWLCCFVPAPRLFLPRVHSLKPTRLVANPLARIATRHELNENPATVLAIRRATGSSSLLSPGRGGCFIGGGPLTSGSSFRPIVDRPHIKHIKARGPRAASVFDKHVAIYSNFPTGWCIFGASLEVQHHFSRTWDEIYSSLPPTFPPFATHLRNCRVPEGEAYILEVVPASHHSCSPGMTL
jgi:hypothetical protein